MDGVLDSVVEKARSAGRGCGDIISYHIFCDYLDEELKPRVRNCIVLYLHIVSIGSIK